MGVFTDRGMSAVPHTLSPKKDTMSYMQFRSVGWARPTSRAMRKLGHIRLRGGGCCNRLLPLVALHHSNQVTGEQR